MKKINFVLAAVTAFVALVLAVFLLLQPWQMNRYVEVLAPPRDIAQQERLLREQLNFYEKSVEQLKSLASLLLGLSTLFAISLGVSSYIGVQDAKDRADDTVKNLTALEGDTRKNLADLEGDTRRIVEDHIARLDLELRRINEGVDRDLNDLRAEFPLFRRMHESIRGICNKLQEFIPDADYGRDVFQKIDVAQKTMIEHYERAVGAFEFFDLAPFSEDASRIYTMLGSYYSHKFAREQKASSNQPGIVPDPGDTSRARFYLNLASAIAPDRVAALNEIGYLEVIVTGDMSRAVPSLQTSLVLVPDQQRAGYYLAITEHVLGNSLRVANAVQSRIHFGKSKDLLTEALGRTRWQTVEEDDRYRRAMLYNRACAYARLAELSTSEAERDFYSSQAVDDLRQTFPPAQKPGEQRLIDFKADFEKDGDLVQLAQNEKTKQEVEAIRKSVLSG
jgi:hypothetical protein